MSRKKPDGHHQLHRHLSVIQTALRFVSILTEHPMAADTELAAILPAVGVRMSGTQHVTMPFHYSQFTGWSLDIRVGGYQFSIAPEPRSRSLWSNVTWFGGTNSGPVLGAVRLLSDHTFEKRMGKYLKMVARHAKKTTQGT